MLEDEKGAAAIQSVIERIAKAHNVELVNADRVVDSAEVTWMASVSEQEKASTAEAEPSRADPEGRTKA